MQFTRTHAASPLCSIGGAGKTSGLIWCGSIPASVATPTAWRGGTRFHPQIVEWLRPSALATFTTPPAF